MMEKRTLLAVILTMAVWLAWFWYFAPEKSVNPPESVTTEQAATTETNKTVEEPKKASAVAMPVINKNIKEEKLDLKTGKFSFVLSNKGAKIEKANYSQRNIELSLEDGLFNSKGGLDFALHFSEEEFLKGSALDDILWNVERIDDTTVKFSTDLLKDGNDLRIEKTYRFSEKGYDFFVDYRIVNKGKNEAIFNSGIIFSPGATLGPKLDYSNRYNNLTGIYSIGDDYEQNHKGGGFFSAPEILKKKSGSVDYTGVMSRYFLLIMIPQQFTGNEMLFDNRADSGYRTGLRVDIGNIAAGSEAVRSFRIYLGEKDKELLGAVDEKIVAASDVSTLIEPIRYFVIWALMGINRLFNNLGWSLVIFSILTKIVFMPLTKKSTDSMKKMQEIAPQIKKLQEKYKDKPDVLQKETMKLYKENNVNPLGGCLPLLLQMPFFFALYSALINSIDLWNAPFMLWMKDLSMPDTVAYIAGIQINILPLLMTASTFIQQKQTTVDTGNQQQKILMYMMPILLLFIFWTMPSGLVLYWFLQNLYQIIHQYVATKLSKAS